jgi:hypothetical protein
VDDSGGGGVNKVLVVLFAGMLTLVPDTAFAQRFGGDYGAGAGFWLLYINPGVDASESFGKDLGNIAALGGRLFFQTGRFRLGGAAFGGSFVDEGVNEAGFKVSGGLSAAGVTAEYLAVQTNLEVIFGGMFGGGTLNIEEQLDVTSGVETLRRRIPRLSSTSDSSWATCSEPRGWEDRRSGWISSSA